MDQLLFTQGSSAAFSLLGQEVVVATDSVYLQGDDVNLGGFSLDQDAAQATVKVIDADGHEVATFSWITHKKDRTSSPGMEPTAPVKIFQKALTSSK